MNNAELLAKGNKFVEYLHFPSVLKNCNSHQAWGDVLDLCPVSSIYQRCDTIFEKTWMCCYVPMTTGMERHTLTQKVLILLTFWLFNQIYLDKLSIREVLEKQTLPPLPYEHKDLGWCFFKKPRKIPFWLKALKVQATKEWGGQVAIHGLYCRRGICIKDLSSANHLNEW